MEEERRSFGQQLKYLWDESLARHVVVHRDGQKPVDLPLIVVIVAAVVAPWLVAGGAIVALVMGFRIQMTRPGSDGIAEAASDAVDAAAGTVERAADAVSGAVDDATSSGGSEERPQQ